MNNTTKLPAGTTKIESSLPGPTLAIFAGVHGNELAGILALQELKETLKVKRGVVYLVLANPPAIKKGVRLVSKNLNRCFYKSNKGDSYEDARARELMAILDKCDALLDLHTFNEDSGQPFIICEDNAMDIATKFDVDIISTNWSKAEPGGTDDYMYSQGKIGVCAECGPSSKANEFKPFALSTALQFLKFFDVIDTKTAYSITDKKIIRAERSVIRTSKNYYLDTGLSNFQKLSPGRAFGAQNGKDFVASIGECIIFPRPRAPIGAEAFIIGREMPVYRPKDLA